MRARARAHARVFVYIACLYVRLYGRIQNPANRVESNEIHEWYKYKGEVNKMWVTFVFALTLDLKSSIRTSYIGNVTHSFNTA